MDKEKLHVAASSHSDWHGDRESDAYEDFVAGAEWLQKQPLAERLNEDEKAKIIAFFNGNTFGELDFIELISCRRILKSIFGAEIFTTEESSEKNNDN